MSFADDEGYDAFDEDDFQPDPPAYRSNTFQTTVNRKLHITKYWRNGQPFLWKPKGKCYIVIEDMDDEHLTRAIYATAKKPPKSYQYLCQEAAFRNLKVF